MNTKLVLLLVALMGHAVVSRPDSYESYENLELSSPYGSSSEEGSAEIALQQRVDIAYDPKKDGLPEEHYERMRAKYGSVVKPEHLETYKEQYEEHQKYLKALEKVRRQNRGEPLPEPTADELAKIDMKLNNAELDRTNELRALHDAPPLQFNEKLAVYAKKYAEKISAKMALGAKFEHNPVRIYRLGENAAQTVGPAKYDGFSTNDWYFGEIDNYKHNGNRRSVDNVPNAFETGHFTQVVWHDTKEMGCGSACAKGAEKCMTVCNYYPSGNVQIGNRDGSVNEEKTDKKFAKNVNMDIDWPTVYQLKKEVEESSPVLKTNFERDERIRGY